MNTRISACCPRGNGRRFGATDRFHIQFPLMQRLSAALASQVSVQLSLRFGESLLRFLSRAASGIVRVLHFLHELLNFRICRRVRIDFGIASRQPFVGCFDLVAPAGFRGPVQLVESRIGCVRDFSHRALAKQPREHRPIHGLGHQCLGFFHFWKLSHSEKKIAGRERKVQLLLPDASSLMVSSYA